jgi:hypothetical protein
MDHPTDVKPASAVVGEVFLAVVQLGLSEWLGTSSLVDLVATWLGCSNMRVVVWVGLVRTAAAISESGHPL